MSERVAHPRALAVFRIALYLFAAVAAVGFAGITASYLGLLVVASGVVAVLTGGVNLVPLAAIAVAVLAVAGGLVVGVATLARRVDRAVTRYDRAPDPVEVVKRQYVDGTLTEEQLERRLDRLFGVGRDPASRGASATESRAVDDATRPSGVQASTQSADPEATRRPLATESVALTSRES